MMISLPIDTPGNWSRHNIGVTDIHRICRSSTSRASKPSAKTRLEVWPRGDCRSLVRQLVHRFSADNRVPVIQRMKCTCSLVQVEKVLRKGDHSHLSYRRKSPSQMADAHRTGAKRHKACISCQKLRAKCDNARPCSQCVARSVGASCEDKVGARWPQPHARLLRIDPSDGTGCRSRHPCVPARRSSGVPCHFAFCA
jgi:hypothetical protein